MLTIPIGQISQALCIEAFGESESTGGWSRGSRRRHALAGLSLVQTFEEPSCSSGLDLPLSAHGT